MKVWGINNLFTDTDITELKNKVAADLFGVELPFVGVDGNSVCDKILTADGQKAECPLKAGVKYTYKDSFPVLEFYPNIEAKVKWALITSENKSVICFVVPVKIVSKK